MEKYKEKVYFIGAGPGDPELITIKGQRIVKEADVIIYAGSLVPKEVIDCHKEGAEIYNSASMSLDEVIDVTVKAIKENKKVARVHTGDPAIYGAHREQMDMLDEHGIEYEVIPGVSSFLASAAALKKEGQNGVLPKTLPTRNMKRQINEETETSIQWTGKKIVNVCVNSEGFDCFELKQQKDHVDVTFTVATP